MTNKGFAKAEDVERLSKEEMDLLSSADGVAAVESQKQKRATKAYKDEFTEKPKVTEADVQGAGIDVPEEFEEPEPEVKQEKKKPVETVERSSKEIAQDIYNQGFNAGYKHRTKEILAMLVD